MARSAAAATMTQRVQRADARRNAKAILDAAVAPLTRDPEVSMAGVATAAGVGRVTLCRHNRSRAS
ncbi:hypothetical protein Afe04nite_03620 [Asanoa ferruginea]|nr:hypothetical protein Afe04nite_03620 [Asanoa ferruginea]